MRSQTNFDFRLRGEVNSRIPCAVLSSEPADDISISCNTLLMNFLESIKHMFIGRCVGNVTLGVERHSVGGRENQNLDLQAKIKQISAFKRNIDKNISFRRNCDRQYIRPAAHGAIFRIDLFAASGNIDKCLVFLAARRTLICDDVFVVHNLI